MSTYEHQLEWSYFEICSVFFSADLSCESASHHFELFYFETGSLVGFVILELPVFFSGVMDGMLGRDNSGIVVVRCGEEREEVH